MELTQYVETVRDQVAQASALADESSQHVAQRLSASIDAALRLALIQALADAASEISADLAPGSVELRMQGANPTFAVSLPETETTTDVHDVADSDDFDTDSESDEPQARISLRLPQSTKTRIDEAAAREGLSANSWISRAVHMRLRRDEFAGDARDRRRGGRGRNRGRGRGPNRPPFAPGMPPFGGPESGPQPGRRGFGPGFGPGRGRGWDGDDEGGRGPERYQGWAK